MGHMSQHCNDESLNKASSSCSAICANLSIMGTVHNRHDPIGYICNGDPNTCELLHAQMNHYFNDEFYVGTDDENDVPSVDDARCLEIYKRSIVKTDGRYHIKLPLKKDACLPNNRSQAESRLLQQKKNDEKKSRTENFL